MSAPFPSAPVVSASGGKIAWVYNARGVRNIWIAEPPAYRGHSVTSYTADDGQEVSELQWTPDGRQIVYVRGESANGAGEYPNPTSDPRGAEQQVWVVAIEGPPAQKAPRLIGEGNQPEVSPKGGIVAFVRKGQIWSAPLAAADDGKQKAEQLIHARGQNSGLHWSPDGARLAYVSSRGNHGFIGVYDAAAKAVKYLDPSVDRDEAPVWSPDSRQLAFVRIPSTDEHRFFMSARSGPPWSIRGGRCRDRRRQGDLEGRRRRRQRVPPIGIRTAVVLGRPPDCVSVGARRLAASVLGCRGGRRRGAADSGQPSRWSTLRWRRTAASWCIPRTRTISTGGTSGAWRRPGRAVAVTSGTGMEWSPAVPGDGAIVFIHADTARQARPAIRLASGEVRDLAPDAIPADFPSDALVAPQQVIFSAADGMTLHGQLFLPQEQGRAAASGGDFFPRRIAAADAARLALHVSITTMPTR